MMCRQEFFGHSLIEAVKEDDLDLVKMLLTKGAPVDVVDECGYTALHWAAIYDKPEYAHALLTLGDKPTDIDILDKDGYTALQLGIKHRHKDITQLLITYGADINGNQQNLPSPVELASERGFDEILSVLNTAQENKQSIAAQIPKKWKLGKLLGCGGFGKVFIGYDLIRSREIAVKKVRTNSNKALMSMERTSLDCEIKVLRNLNHRNIVQCYGMEIVNSTMHIFMEFMAGGSIRDYVSEKGRLNEDQVRCYCYQILEGVEYLHSNMVIHRDIKGANILLTADFKYAKLADFGLSKRLKRCSTVNGLDATLGSPYWMAPEVVRASSSNGEGYGRKADIWSIGCTIIEMLTCKPPWSTMEPMSAVYNIGSGRTPPEMPKDLSMGLKDILLQMFKRDPKCRPNAKDLLNHPFITNEEESIAKKTNRRIRKSIEQINHRLSKTFERASRVDFGTKEVIILVIVLGAVCALVSVFLALLWKAKTCYLE